MFCRLFFCARFFFFFFNDTATTEIYTLSLHDALPISRCARPAPAPRLSLRSGSARESESPPRRPLPNGAGRRCARGRGRKGTARSARDRRDRESTRLNSSHANISYAVFCLKKKKKKQT